MKSPRPIKFAKAVSGICSVFAEYLQNSIFHFAINYASFSYKRMVIKETPILGKYPSGVYCFMHIRSKTCGTFTYFAVATVWLKGGYLLYSDCWYNSFHFCVIWGVNFRVLSVKRSLRNFDSRNVAVRPDNWWRGEIKYHAALLICAFPQSTF